MFKSKDSDFYRASSVSEHTTQDLRQAIENLEKFALLNAAEPVPHFCNLDIKEGQLVPSDDARYQSVVGLARCFVTALLSDRVRREHEALRDTLQNEILKAIDIIKNSYLLLNKLKHGDDTQRKLAEAATGAIDRFNQVIRDAHDNGSSWGKRLVRFLFKQTGFALSEKLVGKTIELPLIASHECQSPPPRNPDHAWHKVQPTQNPTANPDSLMKISTLAKPLQDPKGLAVIPTHREVDAFRVKAVTMIRNYGFPSTSMGEALKAVRQAPVQGASEEISNEMNSGNATIVTFRQTLQPFPGELIVLEGSFRRDVESKVSSVPIPDSFRLFSKSSQTGFPHPVQHNGWGLSDKLLPPYPDAIDRLPLYRTLYEHKRKIALGLLPQGRLLAHAKMLLEHKHELYEIYHDELLTLHKCLALAIANAAGKRKNTDSIEQIKHGFRTLKTGAAAVERLAQVYHRVDEAAITKPTEQLQTAWTSLRGSAAWIAKSSTERRIYAQNIYTEAAYEARELLATQTEGHSLAPLRPLALALTDIIRDGCCEIVMQYMSEKMGFDPVTLSPLAIKLQQAAFNQLMAFLVEMELDPLEDRDEMRALIKTRLFASLERDIACFDNISTTKHGRSVTLLTEELEHYYHHRSLMVAASS